MGPYTPLGGYSMKRISISFLLLLAAFLCPFFQLDAMQAASSNVSNPEHSFTLTHEWQEDGCMVEGIVFETGEDKKLCVGYQQKLYSSLFGDADNVGPVQHKCYNVFSKKECLQPQYQMLFTPDCILSEPFYNPVDNNGIHELRIKKQYQNSLHAVDIKTNKSAISTKEHLNDIVRAFFIPNEYNNNTVLSLSSDRCCIWQNGKLVQSMLPKDNEKFHQAAVDKDGEYLALGSYELKNDAYVASVYLYQLCLNITSANNRPSNDACPSGSAVKLALTNRQGQETHAAHIENTHSRQQRSFWSQWKWHFISFATVATICALYSLYNWKLKHSGLHRL